MSIPTSTYRIQFRDGMTLDRAAELAPYLKALGVSHLYASPIFSATAGSTHGYDVTDHNEIDPCLGGRAGFDRLSDALQAHGLGLVVDIVPNHMAASLENPWWRSVIEWGERSPFARHFDIDWSERLTLPVLGQPFADAAAAGEIRLVLDADHDCLALGYFDQRLPLDPRSYRIVLDRIADPAAGEIAEAAEAAAPDRAEALRDALRSAAADAGRRARLEAALDQLSGDGAFLERVHAEQPWRLRFWKEARKHLSYRRFFEVTGLVGVRVEDGAVFDDVHRLILDLVRSGRVDGLRIDHVDGLADPKAYLGRLRREAGPDTYIIVEKILGHGETLPVDWPVSGTTGYEFIAALAGVLTSDAGADALDRAYAERAGEAADPEAEQDAAKRLMVTHNFEGELNALVRIAGEIAGGSAQGPSAGADAIRAALVETVIAFPVYRTYGTEAGLPEADRDLLDQIASRVRAGGAADDRALDLVLAILRADAAPEHRDAAARFRTRFQQLTGPIMAKAIEDTFFYRYGAQIALNEVGGDPGARNGSVARFHAAMAARARSQPDGLSATATHDTKRGEDARARLYTLSEAPEVWSEAVARWCRMNADAVRPLQNGPAPEPEVEWMLYQALAGVWTDEAVATEAALDDLRKRMLGFVEKSLREAKLRTSWTDPEDAYEQAVKDYASRLLSPRNAAFRNDFRATLEPFIRAGAINSLAQTAIKMIAPGIPDIYQGSEGWDFSLVDPDNRRPPDFDALARWQAADAAAPDGAAAKQKLISACLALRRTHPALFARGDYRPLRVSGERAQHVIAFLRAHEGGAVAAIVPRLPLGLLGEDGRLDPSRMAGVAVELPGEVAGSALRNIRTGQTIAAGGALRLDETLTGEWPVAVLIGGTAIG